MQDFKSQPNSQPSGSSQQKGKSKLSVQDEEIEKERQVHLTTIDLLDRVANGDTSASDLLPPELLEDPLDAYLLYVRWTLDTYGSQEENLKKHLVTLLEQSTRRFVNDQRYRSDLRYLKLWVLYARQCSKPGAVQIYEFLYSKKIGAEFSMFYEEWASSIDQHPGCITRIEEIFNLGIKCEAQPFNRLKKRKLAVLQRASQPTSEKGSPLTLPSSNELCDNPLRNHYLTSNNSTIFQASNRDSFAKKAPVPPTQILALDLATLYGKDGTETSPEEHKARCQYGSRRWDVEPWEIEAFTTGNWYYYNLDGSPILYDPVSREPLFEYLKERSPTSSAMQLSDGEVAIDDFFHSESDSPDRTTQDADQSMATSEHMAHLSLSNMTSSTDSDDEVNVSGQQAVADAEISIKLESPARGSSTAYVKARNRRASVTMNTQEALYDVYNMYGKPVKSSDESDDNFDNSEPGDEDRMSDENTAFTVAGIRDATADVTFWSQPTKNSKFNKENDSDVENPASIQDENAVAYRLPQPGPSEPASRGQSRGLGAFMPVRKPLANVVPYSHQNDVSMTPFSCAQNDFPAPRASANKRIPLAVKATHHHQPPINQDNLHDPESDERITHVNTLGWPTPSSPNQMGREYHTPEIGNDAAHFSLQENHGLDVDIDYEGSYAGESDYENENNFDRAGRLISRPLRFVPIGDNFNALTPITERTSEYSSMTAPRYINRTQEARFSIHQPNLKHFPTSEFGDDSQNDLTPKANNFNEEDSDEMNVNVHDERLLEPQASGSMRMEACELRASSAALNQHRMYHSETPSKLRARLHQLGDTSSPNFLSRSPMEDNAEDSFMISPSHSSSNHHRLTSPTKIQACEPCNPFATDIVNILLEGLDPPLDVYPGFQSLMDQAAHKLDQMRRRCKTRNRKHSQSSITADEALWEIDLGDDQYIIYEKLGEGTYGSVFRVSEAVDEDCTAIYEDTSIQKAMKVESPPNLYEFSILSQLHQTLPQRLCHSIIKPHKLYAYADESFLLMDYSDQGTLLDIVNRAADIGIKPTAPGITRGVDEIVAMFFTIELMRVVEGLHEAGYIHGDLKIDNCMVRLQSLPGGSKSWTSAYRPDGQDGWSYKGLKLIDYGQSIDTGVFPPSQEFIAEWQTDEYDCIEMRTGKPWTFQPDYHGILGIAHCLLLGSFMTENDSIKPGFKRYHQIEIWNNLFEVCLRPREIPNTADLKSVRLSMETWLQQNCERNGKSLKGFLKKIEVASLSAYH